MSVTLGSDVFVPEVIADITTDILFRDTPLVNSPYVADGSPAIAAFPTEKTSGLLF